MIPAILCLAPSTAPRTRAVGWGGRQGEGARGRPCFWPLCCRTILIGWVFILFYFVHCFPFVEGKGRRMAAGAQGESKEQGKKALLFSRWRGKGQGGRARGRPPADGHVAEPEWEAACVAFIVMSGCALRRSGRRRLAFPPPPRESTQI
jgi:hypothetical protein